MFSFITCVELTSFKARRVVAFRKNLIEMTELEIKHAKVRMRICYMYHVSMEKSGNIRELKICDFLSLILNICVYVLNIPNFVVNKILKIFFSNDVLNSSVVIKNKTFYLSKKKIFYSFKVLISTVIFKSDHKKSFFSTKSTLRNDS